MYLNSMAKILIITGLLIALFGVIILVAQKIPWFGKLPGDVCIKRDNFTIYFPVTTCILLSIVVSLILYLITKR